ncbi:variable surface lipoprotein [Mycoplasma struthionis]|uniref:Variable surface lipoprotein n=1 Tax=Mycoplasma struthionis TaxID=538220 RepID=A0A502M2J0_9MOLU|nr:variable surface lipoprotein [Mycoplasma struthionis]TPI01943.1 variable surface lipoprotein [Mycoplasma struthionis]
MKKSKKMLLLLATPLPLFTLGMIAASCDKEVKKIDTKTTENSKEEPANTNDGASNKENPSDGNANNGTPNTGAAENGNSGASNSGENSENKTPAEPEIPEDSAAVKKLKAVLTNEEVKLKPQSQEVLQELYKLIKNQDVARQEYIYGSKRSNKLKIGVNRNNANADESKGLVLEFKDDVPEKEQLNTYLYNTIINADNGPSNNAKYIPIKWEDAENGKKRFYLYVRFTGDGSSNISDARKIPLSEGKFKIYINDPATDPEVDLNAQPDPVVVKPKTPKPPKNLKHQLLLKNLVNHQEQPAQAIHNQMQ